MKGIMHGRGSIVALDKTVYDGMFEQGKKHGQGKFFVQGGTYSLLSIFKDGKPEFEANLMTYKQIKNEEEELLL